MIDQRSPEIPALNRSLPAGIHPYLSVVPRARELPAMRRIFKDASSAERILASAQVHIREERGYAWVDETVPCIVLARAYYLQGRERDLYLDLLHELTHLRQIDEGQDVWDERFEYVDRPTEIEGYAVAVEEARRLGMSEAEIVEHLSNPWMSEADVRRLLENVARFLAAG